MVFDSPMRFSSRMHIARHGYESVLVEMEEDRSAGIDWRRRWRASTARSAGARPRVLRPSEGEAAVDDRALGGHGVDVQVRLLDRGDGPVRGQGGRDAAEALGEHLGVADGLDVEG